MEEGAFFKTSVIIYQRYDVTYSKACASNLTSATTLQNSFTQYRQVALESINRSINLFSHRSQWPSGLRRDFAGARLLGLWFEFQCEHGCLCLVSVVSYKFLRRADSSSRGVLPTVVCHWVWSRNLKNVATLARFGLLYQKKKTDSYSSSPHTVQNISWLHFWLQRTLKKNISNREAAF